MSCVLFFDVSLMDLLDLSVCMNPFLHIYYFQLSSGALCYYLLTGIFSDRLLTSFTRMILFYRPSFAPGLASQCTHSMSGFSLIGVAQSLVLPFFE